MSSQHMSEISSLFGEVLRQYRVEREVSQEELAYLAGVDRTFVSRLERGIRQPTITTMIGIGLALGVSAADMVRDTEREYLKQADIGSRLAQTPERIKERAQQYRKSVRGQGRKQ